MRPIALFMLWFGIHNHWGEQNCLIIFLAQVLHFSELENKVAKVMKIIKCDLWDNISSLINKSTLNRISTSTTNLGRNNDSYLLFQLHALLFCTSPGSLNAQLFSAKVRSSLFGSSTISSSGQGEHTKLLDRWQVNILATDTQQKHWDKADETL